MPQPTGNSLVKKNIKTVYRAIFFCYAVFLFTVTLSPLDYLKSNEPGWLSFFDFDHQDKIVHTLLFFVFTGLMYFGYKFSKAKLFTFSLLTGILIEVLQYYLHLGRNFDVIDIAANALGTLIMIGIIIYLNKKYSVHTTN